MSVLLEAIIFNHDSAATGAFNIRRNETQFVAVPEWQRGVSVKPEDSPAAYAIAETRGKRITIQAKFKCRDETLEPVRVRAIDAKESRRAPLGGGPVGMTLRAAQSATRPLVGNVLGEVKGTQVEFNADGESDFVTFELQNVQLLSTGVSASTTTWRWQYRLPARGDWTDFAITSHRIYTVLEVPKAPWQQQPYNSTNTQLPWADALEYACQWAASAQGRDEAATLVTHNVNDLGLSLACYTGSSIYACPNFDCTKFLQLLCDGKGMGQQLNCSDCAAIVSSFANLLGCELWQSTIGTFFKINPIKVIGSQKFETGDNGFRYHEVAWKGDATADDEVFDACLQVDGDEDPSKSPFKYLLAANLVFGRSGEQNYRFRLSPPPPTIGPDPCMALPDEKQRRNIGHSKPGNCGGFNLEELEFLKQHYDYDTWSSFSNLRENLLVDEFFTDKTIFTGWELDSLQYPQMLDVVAVVQSLWRHTGKNPEMLLRVDAFESKTSEDAQSFTLQRLMGFQRLNVERLYKPVIGDVAFVESGEVSVLFARSQYVFLVRSVGREPVPITGVAFQLDQYLIQLTANELL